MQNVMSRHDQLLSHETHRSRTIEKVKMRTAKCKMLRAQSSLAMALPFVDWLSRWRLTCRRYCKAVELHRAMVIFGRGAKIRLWEPTWSMAETHEVPYWSTDIESPSALHFAFCSSHFNFFNCHAKRNNTSLPQTRQLFLERSLVSFEK